MQKKQLQIRDKTIFDGVFVKLILKKLYEFCFKLGGWKTLENAPKGAGVTIAAPHTSNWDFIYALGAAIILDVKIYFSIKDSWCRLPVIGKIILWMGAIPIDRSEGAKGQVDLIKEFVSQHQNSRVFFLFTPEGTRGGVAKWKTGFYHVALDTGLPIFLAKVDYKTKEAGVFHSYRPSGDKEADIAKIQESYKHVCGRFPEEQFPNYLGPITDLEEDEKRLLIALASATQLENEVLSSQITQLASKGLIDVSEESTSSSNKTTYQLTSKGMGYVFHLTPES